MSDFDVEAIVVGAGAVGLATGYALARRGIAPIVLEREDVIGHGVSSRNSEVIHGGLYYPTGSLKARLCVEGRRALYAFLESHGVSYARCGKIVVATSVEEHEKLGQILEQARTNGVEGMARLSAGEVRAREPDLFCTEALFSPESGMLDSHGFMTALVGEIEEGGGSVVLKTPFEGATPLETGGFQVRTGGADPMALTTRWLALAGGLAADRLARSIEGFPAQLIPTIYFGKGNYFALSGKAPFRHLVYPLPMRGALGTHYRRDLGGQARFGPDLHFVEEEDYEVETDRLPLFYDTIRRFWPALPDGALVPDYTGIRPKIHSEGQPQPDFRIEGAVIHGLPGLIAMFGIESPGLTSSLAIGEEAASCLANSS